MDQSKPGRKSRKTVSIQLGVCWLSMQKRKHPCRLLKLPSVESWLKHVVDILSQRGTEIKKLSWAALFFKVIKNGDLVLAPAREIVRGLWRRRRALDPGAVLFPGAVPLVNVGGHELDLPGCWMAQHLGDSRRKHEDARIAHQRLLDARQPVDNLQKALRNLQIPEDTLGVPVEYKSGGNVIVFSYVCVNGRDNLLDFHKVVLSMPLNLKSSARGSGELS